MKRAPRISRNSVTMHEVAKLAGVSPMTVSRVLSGSASVSAGTRQSVQEAIQQLNYSPNIAARNLAKAALVRLGAGTSEWLGVEQFGELGSGDRLRTSERRNLDGRRCERQAANAVPLVQ